MALVISPVAGAAILLPLMIIQDAVGVWAFRREFDGWILAVMLPGAAAGTALGYIFARHISVEAVMLAVGIISLVFSAYRLWIERKGTVPSPDSPGWVGSLYGLVSGFTSQIALAGALPFQMWVAPRRLAPPILAGTSAIYFAAINWMKVPAFAALDQFNRTNALATLVLLPVAVASTFAGVWMVRRLDAARFYPILYLLMMAIGIRLIWSAIA